MKVPKAVLAKMGRRLAGGPIIIGEDHTEPWGREAVITLMYDYTVSFLSLEAPIAPRQIAKSDGQLVQNVVREYTERFGEIANVHLSLATLIHKAMKKGIPVYCHDMPYRTSQLSGYNGYIQDAQTYGSVVYHAKDLTRKLAERNAFAANFLKDKLGNGVNKLMGLVLLVGYYHTTPKECGGGDNTIQAKLGIPEDRVFRID